MLTYFLHWYTGALYSNIIADVLFATAGYLWGRRHINRLHRELGAQAARTKLMHKHIRQIHQHLGLERT